VPRQHVFRSHLVYAKNGVKDNVRILLILHQFNTAHVHASAALGPWMAKSPRLSHMTCTKEVQLVKLFHWTVVMPTPWIAQKQVVHKTSLNYWQSMAKPSSGNMHKTRWMYCFYMFYSVLGFVPISSKLQDFARAPAHEQRHGLRGLHFDIATEFSQLFIKVLQVFRCTACVHHLMAPAASIPKPAYTSGMQWEHSIAGSLDSLRRAKVKIQMSEGTCEAASEVVAK